MNAGPIKPKQSDEDGAAAGSPVPGSAQSGLGSDSPVDRSPVIDRSPIVDRPAMPKGRLSVLVSTDTALFPNLGSPSGRSGLNLTSGTGAHSNFQPSQLATPVGTPARGEGRPERADIEQALLASPHSSNARADDPVLLRQMLASMPVFEPDEYVVLRQLYKSEASHVHLAARKSDSSHVVLKFLKSHTKVRHEIKALRAVAGVPGTVQLLELHKTQDEAEIVLSLAEVRARTRHYLPGSVADLKRYMRQLLDTLNRLHLLGIIHRDVKESNCLMSDRVVVIDLGLAVMGDTCVGAAGTKGYISPELQVGVWS